MNEEERRKKAAADRQARYRERRQKHAAGEHDECLPATCEVARAATVDLDGAGLNEPDRDVAGGVTRDVTPTPKNSVSHRDPPADLGLRGQRLWDEMAGLKLGPMHVLLLERACRLADRLARLDALLEGGEWLTLAVQRESTDEVLEVRVTVDRALGETRQHDVALKLLVAELRHAGRPATSAGHTPPAESDGDDGAKGAAAGGNVTSIAGILGSARG